jgi:hypothetical protein
MESSGKVTLVLPNKFSGDIFLVAGDDGDPPFDGHEVVVPDDGVVYISNFDDLLNFSSSRFVAKTKEGKFINNSFNRGRNDAPILFPVGAYRRKLLFFVVGSWKDSEISSRLKDEHWPEIVRQLEIYKRNRKPGEFSLRADTTRSRP